MPFSLSFSEEFFVDGDIDAVAPSDRPSSVMQAILSMSDETWNRIARDVFHVDPDHLDPLVVLERVRETNTCSNLDSPVSVWIDEEGWYDLRVYDSSDASP
ncbi:MAG: hypothetical protein WED34_09595 [Planctomycetales bacterium]